MSIPFPSHIAKEEDIVTAVWGKLCNSITSTETTMNLLRPLLVALAS
jgi:hypothetical protein